ncbi:MAG TPA: class I SAM-dependent methyltransferase [Kofleriaceae bacterium]|nr:class I SAM-dependent methyltransferase [Kofleriaceae bacterium]
MSQDLDARADSPSSTARDELNVTDAVPSTTTAKAAARRDEATLPYAKPLLDKVLREEADFANRDYAPYASELDINPSMFREYAAPSEMYDWRQMAAVLLGDLAGKELLDYGCGMGEESVYFAKLGARVTSIDISEVGIATLKKRAEYHKLDIRAFEMRCDPTSFPASSFDRIHGMGILHHLDIDSALAEVWRLLRPGGIGVFLEPLGDNRAVEAVKKLLVKRARFLAEFDPATEHEHNLTWKEVEAATRRFSRVVTYPYHLLYRLKRFVPRSMWDAVRRFDHGLLSMAPGLRRYAGAVVIQVVK